MIFSPDLNDNIHISDEYVPRSLIESYERELDQYIRRFLEVLLVKTGLANERVLDLKSRLIPADGDECLFLPEDLRPVIKECKGVCGFYNPESHEIVIYLGCFVRPITLGIKLNISLRDYTFFHLLVHHLQATGIGLTKFNLLIEYCRGLTELEKHIIYSFEAEADYLARIFSFLSEEEELKPIHRNKYLKDLWQPMSNALWSLAKICREQEKHEVFKPLSPLDIEIVCYNPFRWLMARISSLLGKMSNIIDVSQPNTEFKAILLNPLGISIREPVRGLYIGDRSICFSVREDKLHVCYSSEYGDRIRGRGFKLEFLNEIDVDLREITGVSILLTRPKASIKLISNYGEYFVEAKLKYTGDPPRSSNPVSTSADIEELRGLIASSIQLPPGVCDAARSLLVIPLPRINTHRQISRREILLELSEIVIPVDKNTCIQADIQYM